MEAGNAYLELSERNIGEHSLKLEMLLRCSKAIGGALPHHNALELTKKAIYPRKLKC
jgi:hypothetical protein